MREGQARAQGEARRILYLFVFEAGFDNLSSRAAARGTEAAERRVAGIEQAQSPEQVEMRQAQVAGQAVDEVVLGVGFEAVGARAAQVSTELLSLAGRATRQRLAQQANAVFVAQVIVAHVEAQRLAHAAPVADFGGEAAGIFQVGVHHVGGGGRHQIAEQHRPEGPRVVRVEIGVGRCLKLATQAVEPHVAGAGLVGRTVFLAVGGQAQVAAGSVAEVFVAQARREAQARTHPQQQLGKRRRVCGAEVEIGGVAARAGQSQIKIGASTARAALLSAGGGAAQAQAGSQRRNLSVE